jgi:hypothetical protein
VGGAEVSKFKEGDRVKVYNPKAWNNGKTGTVRSHHENGIVNLVYDDSPRDHVSGVWHEDLRYELTEEQEIEKIAEALKREGIPGWADEHYLRAATNLYKEGVRYNV